MVEMVREKSENLRKKEKVREKSGILTGCPDLKVYHSSSCP